jgi:hypothetical protein
MLAILLALAVAGVHPNAVAFEGDNHRQVQAPLQILAGPDFEAVVHGAHSKCPESGVRYATPASLLGVEDEFISALEARDRRHLESVSGKQQSGEFLQCAGRDGASCPAGQTLAALNRAGLLKRFVGAVCRRGAEPWS